MTTKAKFHKDGFLEVADSLVENFSTVINFDGVDDYAQAPNKVWFSGNFTFEAKILVKSINSNAKLFDFGNGPASDNVTMFLSGGTTGQLVCEVYTGATSGGKVISPDPLPQNKWVHIAWTQSGTTATLLKDGAVWITGTTANPASITRTLNYFAKSNTAAHSFGNLLMRDVRIWYTVRTTTEIAANIDKDVTGQSGLYANWLCEGEIASTVKDLVGTGSDLTLYAGAKGVSLEMLGIKAQAFGLQGEVVENRQDGGNAFSFEKSTGNLLLQNEVSDGATNNMTFDGTQSALIQNANALNMKTAITIEFRMRVKALPPGPLGQPTQEANIVEKYSYNQWRIGTHTNGYIHTTINLTDGTTPKYFNDYGTLFYPQLNRLYHIAYVYDSVNLVIQLYVDGTLFSSRAVDPGYTNIVTSGFNAYIGKYNGGANFVGDLEDVRIWSMARTSAQIVTNINKRLLGNEAGLVAYWRFDEKEGNIILDKTVYANHGTMTGTPIRTFE